MKTAQTIFRVIYKSILLSMVLLNLNPTSFYILPFSIVISYFTELENLTK